MQTRRQLLASGAAAIAAFAMPTIVPSSAYGRDGKIPHSERITMGILGCGGRGTYDLGIFLQQPEVHFLAEGDVRSERLGEFHTFHANALAPATNHDGLPGEPEPIERAAVGIDGLGQLHGGPAVPPTSLSARNDKKVLVLHALQNFQNQDSMLFALDHLKAADLEATAAQVAIYIADQVSDKESVIAAMRKILDSGAEETYAKQARDILAKLGAGSQ